MTAPVASGRSVAYGVVPRVAIAVVLVGVFCTWLTDGSERAKSAKRASSRRVAGSSKSPVSQICANVAPPKC